MSSLFHPLAYLLAFASALGLTYSALVHYRPVLVTAFRSRRDEVGETLDRLYLREWSPSVFVWTRYVGAPLAGLAVLLLTRSWVFAILLAVAIHFLPPKLLAGAEARRRDRLESQIVDLINSLVATAKSGMNLQMSLREVADRLPAPISQECEAILRRVEAGQSVRSALADADRRLESPRLGLVLHSLQVHERRGGPLPQLLERIGDSVREIERVEERVKTETSGIRLAARLMVAMPVFLCGLLYLVSPEQVTMLFDTPLGNLMLAVAILLDYVAFKIIHRLSDLEV